MELIEEFPTQSSSLLLRFAANLVILCVILLDIILRGDDAASYSGRPEVVLGFLSDARGQGATLASHTSGSETSALQIWQAASSHTLPADIRAGIAKLHIDGN